jgi:hypothetical protein
MQLNIARTRLAVNISKRNLFEVSAVCFLICIGSELRACDLSGSELSTTDISSRRDAGSVSADPSCDPKAQLRSHDHAVKEASQASEFRILTPAREAATVKKSE